MMIFRLRPSSPLGYGIAIVLIVLCTNVAAFQIDIGKIGSMLSKGKDAVTDISEEKEIEIGRKLSAGLLGAAPLVDSDELQYYVNEVGYWLALQTERPNLPWHFAVLDTDSINAFATPGGYIFITKGLFMILRDEAELAGVLAHEITHTLKKHHLNAIQKNARTGLLSDLVSLKADSEGYNIDPLLDVGMTIYSRGLDKEDEFESDISGAVIATRAGYRSSGLHDVLLSLNAMQEEDDQLSLMFKTHPPASSRLEQLKQHQAALTQYWDDPATVNNSKMAYHQSRLYAAGE